MQPDDDPDNDDLYSLKRALWANQTLMIKIHDHLRDISRTQTSIYRVLQYLAGMGVALVLVQWWRGH